MNKFLTITFIALCTSNLIQSSAPHNTASAYNQRITTEELKLLSTEQIQAIRDAYNLENQAAKFVIQANLYLRIAELKAALASLEGKLQ